MLIFLEESVVQQDETPFEIPEKQNVASFLKLHPIQPESCRLSHCFTRQVEGQKIPRKWLSYNIEDDKFYCSFCMAFDIHQNNFKTGVILNIKHTSTRIKEHEKSDYHLLVTTAYIKHCGSNRIDTLLSNEQRTLRISNVRKNQEC